MSTRWANDCGAWGCIRGAGPEWDLAAGPFLRMLFLRQRLRSFAGAKPGELYVSMYPIVAPALVFVGFLMMVPVRKIQWDDVTESLPAFLTIAGMVLGYGITEGIALGCISFAFVKTLAGRRNEVHPLMYVIAAAFILRYAFLMK